MISESLPYRLLVEGADDKHSIIPLMQRHNVNWDDTKEPMLYICDCGGFDPLVKSIKVSVKTYKRLGIIVDANSNLFQRWQQVINEFSQIGIEFPVSPDKEGTIVTGIFSDWKVGIWLMPDNQNKGELEDFLGKLVQSDDKCWSYSDEATKHAKQIGAKFSDKDFCKAKIHTWLSWQENPGLPFGTAITAKFLGANSPEAMLFVQWFKRLFS